MHTLKSTFVLLLLATLLFSCRRDEIHGSGHIISESRSLPAFTNVVVQGTITTNVHYAPTHYAVVRTDAIAMGDVLTAVSGNTLLLAIDDEYNYHNIHFEVDVYMPHIDGLTHEGVANASLDGFYGLDALNVVLTGVGDLRLSGSADHLSIYHDGVGDLNAYGFSVDSCHADLEGVGNIKVSVADLLEGNISGVGNIYYQGSAAVQVTTPGVGHVIHVP